MERTIKRPLSVFVIFVISLMILGLFSGVSYGNTSGHSIISGNSTPVHTKIRKLSQMTYIPTKPLSSITQPNQVNVFQEYSKEPAPMGIADYGIGYNNVPYSYNTTSFLGIANISSLYTHNSSLYAPAEMTFQLNINLVFNDGSTQYVYWVQDVADLNTSSGNHLVSFIDNVWNLSAPNANMHNSTILGNGTVANSSGTHFYYDWANPSLPGNNVVLQYPTNIEFKIVSITTSNNQPEVIFMYNDGYGWITYDNVQFKFVNDLTANYGFVVDGSNYEPNGYSYYDAELILGGPGGGTQTNDTLSNVQLQLEYWNGHNFQEIVSAFNFGSDTAEGIENVVAAGMYYTNTGALFTMVTNGTGSLEQIYSQNSIGIINMSTSLQSGALLVNGTPYYFVNGDVNVTLGPGYYDLQLYNSNGFLVAQGNFSLKAGEYLPLTASTSIYTVSFTESNLPSATTWYVNLSTGQSFCSSTNIITFTAPNGTYSYTIATTDKTYEPSPSTGSFIVNAGPVSKSVSFSEVKYTVTFTETGLPSGSSWNITFNGVTYSSANSIITLSAPNGTYSFSASNSSSYYTVNYSGSVSVKGNGVSTSIIYYHYAYISGTVNPHNATVDINGHSVKVTGSGSFNVSEASGTYSIVVSESGYSTYYSNVTLTAGQTKELNVTLNPVKSTPATPSIPPLELYGIVGAMVAIVAVVAVASLMRKKH